MLDSKRTGSSTDSLRFAVLSSGSRGNCTWVGNDDHGVLIDCGPSTKKILELMESVGISGAPIDAVLVTHEHTDHIGSCRVLEKRLRKLYGADIPFYMTEGTWVNANKKCLPESIEIVETGISFCVGPLQIYPITIPHDVSDPVAYKVSLGELSMAVVTDLGRPTGVLRNHLCGLDGLVLESNYDSTLLENGSYPFSVQQRIRSNHGHLSNRQSADLLKSIVSPKLQCVVLAHLSDENNDPDIAIARARRALGESEASLTVGKQLSAHPVIELRPNV
jgi:phosphoribosyl 1,2-cyclic phosphodiesterase